MNKHLLSLVLAGALLAQAQAQTGNSKTIFLNRANMDMTVKPGDNFYQYANGTWLATTPIPASKTSWGSFLILREQSLERMHKLATQASTATNRNSLQQRVGDLYLSMMDSARINQLGMQPIAADLAMIDGLKSTAQVLPTLATMRRQGLGGGLYGMRVGPDRKNVNRNVVNLSQGGTSLPDRDYYLKPGSRNELIRREYLRYVADMFALAGNDTATANAKAKGIMALETALAQAQMSRVEMRDPQKTYNKLAVKQLSETTTLDWRQALTDLGVGSVDTVLVNNPSFFEKMSGLLSTTPLDTWKAYLQWQILQNSASYLSDAFVNRQFGFNRVLTGQKEMAPRWQRASGLVDGRLGELLGQLYVKEYFTPAAKQRMLALVKNVQQTFAGRINRLSWMSPATKKQALLKLNAITNKIGFPDKWENYDGVVVKADDLMGNLRRLSVWNYQKNISKLNQPVDKKEWGMTPPTVNAYYSPTNNEIAFPAGILSFPFFDFAADDAVNYGGIAAVIGHELTHGFDDQGRQYGADGNLNDWWTKEDADRFKEKADMLVKQYDGFVVNDTGKVNGRLTLGENLADLGGLNIAYEAFSKTPQAKTKKLVDGFTPDQRFFLSWAQVWRNKMLPESLAQQVLTDPHSPGIYRTNGIVPHLDAWYKAFNVQPGDKMYLPPTERIQIW